MATERTGDGADSPRSELVGGAGAAAHAAKPEPRSARERRADRFRDPQERLSRAMSKVLRHTAASCGLHMTEDGFALVSELVRCPGFPAGADLDAVLAVVAADAKRRYATRVDEQGRTWVRANQGHSHDLVSREELLVRVTDAAQLPETVVHGTTRRAWESIKRVGLRRMARNEIHLATGDFSDASRRVISGMRRSSEVLVYVDVRRCLERGVPLYKSQNDVVLCPGLGPNGALPTGFFAKAVDAATRAPLDFEPSFEAEPET